MVTLVRGVFTQLPALSEMENADDNKEFILSNSLLAHQQLFSESNIHYLTIHSGSEIVGFIILAVELELKSVEFRRIVVAKKGLGIGQEAINQMEKYVLEELRITRIWLDVFADNTRAQHIYQKLGYQQFDTMPYDNKILLLFEKHLH
ncbi:MULTISPECIES: GNAT family N-acetyltransferase [Pseudoalteromonas]|uniref:GNAT family N-acetyltransferase n=1 Tax=Pseudoalteromonas maricaloris TaxID=184924 RepID=A0A8I2H4G9_9GAMM|nr:MULTISPECIES: GNAT family N-acetyltransferase [Pseudoalteromonas]KID33760.1 histone acetyltransferase [Pseudoalteromonas flavipulchra NCIMB 2033 = ATCC BAA-314]MBD0782127.1 GNAT family N-acetyltransferase [Pseudoalteromonas flavipulchra]NLR21044.1 GNAT family N-acetyltransferase [Pseudoalteromonas maricaloris]QUI61637.1 GNAT family N-acetyltransferase [Pseudoalteromonas sp. A22]RZG11987.1 GNAT family N-acetyltransferase [Pseudoalteromonas sp. CO342X]